MSWTAAAAALLKALEPYFPALAAFVAGWKSEAAHQDAKELKRVEEATRAAAITDHLSDDDVVRQLKKRGMYRVSGK
ncbi:hypothetical protein [Mesorhizobium sp. B2-3-10]|uniref:hypothetical protein n=1 Tax=Mesorhizobium sp. B2-3-10 TaxID=2589954 RepID=UPI00112ED9BC|nr:hypothetical protein [Mesorhizobium sp. B2-3-10]TPL98331.1 hypothetical protein FJ943_15615 [Mesorhizobium sp. B2-3-10]